MVSQTQGRVLARRHARVETGKMTRLSSRLFHVQALDNNKLSSSCVTSAVSRDG